MLMLTTQVPFLPADLHAPQSKAEVQKLMILEHSRILLLQKVEASKEDGMFAGLERIEKSIHQLVTSAMREKVNALQKFKDKLERDEVYGIPNEI